MAQNPKLITARQLIEEKNYEAARALLKTMPNDETAQRWLKKLDEIAPIKEIESKPSAPQPSTQSPRSPIATGLLIVIFFVVVIVLIAAIVIESRPTSIPVQAAQVPTSTPQSAAAILPTSEPTTVSVPTMTNTIQQPWVVSTEISPLDDSTKVVVGRSADAPIRAWLNDVTPTLILRCQSGQFEIYINAGTTFDSSTESDDRAFVGIRWDHEPLQTISLGEATSDDAVFFDDAASTLHQMATHSTLVFGFVPYNSGEVAATFQLAGLGDAIQPLLTACHLPAFGS